MSFTVDHQPGDSIDTEAYAAFCETDDCQWRGGWHHNDTPGDDGEREANDEGQEHLAEAHAR